MQLNQSNRRDLIALLGGAFAWPLAANAQQGARLRRIGALMGYPEGDLQAQANVAALRQGLHDLGWIEGRNVQTDYCWPGAIHDKPPILARPPISVSSTRAKPPLRHWRSS